ncbi:potassium channel family protein [Geomonas sp.]|uniref:potassium channel family protein n=1 Tax=Geomonas sp. TaxID=2651584 RepID=UPI002B49BDFC|nr:potassium channel family protein [Geomonas sp.]HJV35415.1 potassium channel family protein [Geomonas sp.]
MVLWEGFETIILPRRVTRRFRLTRLFYRGTWLPWRFLVGKLPARRQETWLSFFGPLSLLALLTLWAFGLIVGFAMLHWSVGSIAVTHGSYNGFLTDLYLSATTFITLGLGDAVPVTRLSRFLVVVESGMGFGFLALVIGYLPPLNQSFSRREVSISLLDARAGSPPTAFQMLARHGYPHGMEALRELLHEWEIWSADFLEGHLSYPILAYFRSQHDNQSWLGALTAILDTCALVMAGVEGFCERQAELTFAIARHALVDLSLVFRTRPRKGRHERLPPEQLAQLLEELSRAGIKLKEAPTEERLTELRRMYEPYVEALASYFHLKVPRWMPDEHKVDNWQASSWDRPEPPGHMHPENETGSHF